MQLVDWLQPLPVGLMDLIKEKVGPEDEPKWVSLANECCRTWWRSHIHYRVTECPNKTRVHSFFGVFLVCCPIFFANANLPSEPVCVITLNTTPFLKKNKKSRFIETMLKPVSNIRFVSDSASLTIWHFYNTVTYLLCFYLCRWFKWGPQLPKDTVAFTRDVSSLPHSEE